MTDFLIEKFKDNTITLKEMHDNLSYLIANKITLEEILEKTLGVYGYYAIGYNYTKSELENEIIKFCLDNEVNINELNPSSFSLTIIHSHLDLLLNHPTNPLSLTTLKERIFDSYHPKQKDDKGNYSYDTYTLELLDITVDLIETLYKKEALGNFANYSNINLELYVVTKLDERKVIDNETMLKLALKAETKDYSNNIYYKEDVVTQEKLIKKYLAQQQDI